MVDAVRDMLESDEWNIETCADGTEKLKKIAGDTYYYLLLFDNSLPGINGLNLLQQVRRTLHRLHTPIVILLSDPIGDEGLRAGANAALLKPENISAIAETITRLLKTASKTAEHRPADPGPRIDYNPSHKCLESPKPNSDRLAFVVQLPDCS